MSSKPNGHRIAAHLTTIRGPYSLFSGPHLFTDWRFIDAGLPSYVDAQGKAIPLKGDGELRQAWYQGVNVPRGIRIIAEKPFKSDPVEGPMGATVIYDNGIYKSWSGANYSESEDGFHWKIPVIPGEEPGQDRNDLFFAKTGVHGPGVFIDPSAPDNERYKMVFMSELGHGREKLREKIYEDFKRNRPCDIDPVFDVRGAIDGIFGAVSPDGIQWRLIEEPFLLHMSDNPSTMYYDTLLQKYVYYTRVNWMYGRRSIGRSESDTFGPFPQPEMVVWPDLDRLPSDDLYTNAKCIYPGTVDQHFLFPTVYHRAEDNCSIDMMSSPDGIHWFKLPGNPILDGDPETFDDGCLFTLSCGLVPLRDGMVGLPYKGSSFPHKYPRWPDRNERGKARYAIWKPCRLACVDSQGEGFFATPVLKSQGRQLRLNIKTAVTGEVKVEVVGIDSWIRKKTEKVITGRSFDDCDPAFGDHISKTVTWKGQADLGHAADQPLYFRFRLRAARLYAFELA